MLDVGTPVLLYSGRYEIGRESQKNHAYSTVFVQSKTRGPVAATITGCDGEEYEVQVAGGPALQRVKPEDIFKV